ncbi:helix-turn-helix transcriptional regulator [Nocardiopsis sp. ARC36]
MSTIFGHGRLRLYLLKLLDESPRHGYEIISLLRDRFLGVYSPSPGTIYPRLARLEEEGLVTHTEEGGRKVYRLTDKGRAELRGRSGDLDDLEKELTDSVRDVARAVKQDVRATISSLREELKFAAGGARRPESPAGGGRTDGGREEAPGPAPSAEEADTSERRAPEAGEPSEESSGRQDGARDRAGDQGCEDGSRWAREWERFAQGFGAFGAVWSRGDSERRAGGPEFDQALRDFGDRVRDVVREAGHVGEAAAHDLRRILDDTVEVIRKDARNWGPTGDGGAGTGTSGDAAEEARDAGDAPGPEGSGDPGGPAGTHAAPGERAQDGPEARPMPSAPGGDPWSEAVGDPGDGNADGAAEGGDAPEPGSGSADGSGGKDR